MGARIFADLSVCRWNDHYAAVRPTSLARRASARQNHREASLNDYPDRYRKALESTLGAPLKPEEIEPVPGPSGLTAAQVDVARRLARRDRILCVIYLRACAGVRAGEATQYITEVLGSR